VDFGVAGTCLGYLLYLSIYEVNFGCLLYIDDFEPTVKFQDSSLSAEQSLN
jgi:hypothetical protein